MKKIEECRIALLTLFTSLYSTVFHRVYSYLIPGYLIPQKNEELNEVWGSETLVFMFYKSNNEGKGGETF